MKGFILVCGILACAHALPARKSESDEFFDKFFGPSFFGDDASSRDSSSSSSEPEDSREVSPFLTPFLFPIRIFPAFPSIFRDVSIPTTDPETKLTNSTSETKIINGKKVVVDNKYYENPKTGSVLTIKTVRINFDKDLKPAIPEKDVPVTDELPTETTSPKDRSTDENEIREELGEDTTGDDLLA